MFKKNQKYIYIFFGIFIAIVVIQYLLPKPVNWSRTYMSKDKSPFGCYAIYNLIEGVYANKFTLSNQTLYSINDKAPENTSVLIINDNVDLNKNDMRSMFELLHHGNNVFIAATHFDGLLADTFHLRTRFAMFNYMTSIDSLINRPGEKIRFTAKNLSKKSYSYTQIANVSGFENFDSTSFKIHAVLPDSKACLISTVVGKGKLYLMSVPDVFGNYFVVNHDNKGFAYTCLSMIKNKEMYWDEYYKSFNVKSGSPIKFILESDTLYAAYLLLFFTLLFYMIFEGRRRQRAIPVKEPVTNTTLEFVNVITHVYYNSKNHQSIATERIKYFYETVRKKFNVSTNDINDVFCTEISDLSGIEFKKVKQLFSYCERLKQAVEISEYDLVELNRQISNFNKNSLR
ncbi:MAG: hypothetical protein K0S32_1559 [Bacteroidetes bacterium]|jgi:hypothetical protein|nr:hypothetical protein [Bacteroidota bacterium]